MERLDMLRPFSGDNGGKTSSVVGLTARFSEITVRDRKARISDLVEQICDTPPLIEGHMILNTGCVEIWLCLEVSITWTGAGAQMNCRRSPSLRRRTTRSSAMAVRSATGMRSAASVRHTSAEREESPAKANGIPPLTKSVSMSVLSKAHSNAAGCVDRLERNSINP